MNTPTNIDMDKTSDFIVSCFQLVQEQGAPIRGSIHSVYKHTVNLQFGDNLIALQSAGSPASPVSVILPLSGNQMDDLKLTQLTPCFLYGDSIEIHDQNSLILIHFKDCTAVYTSKNPSLSNCGALKEALNMQIQRSDKGGFSTILNEPSEEPADMILAGALKRLHKSEKFLSADKPEEAAKNLAEVIGLGTGLTPSGDDFLCGVLSVLQSTEAAKSTFHSTLEKSIQQNVYRTNDISGEFLRAASNGRYSEPVVNLFTAASSGESDLQKYTEEFLKIGHSSGIDTLCGMFWGLTHVLGA